MKSFTKKVTTKAGTYDFIFRMDAGAGKKSYTVTIIEDDYVSQPFTMEEKGGTWKISNVLEVALWIYLLEPELATAIGESVEVPMAGAFK